MNIKQNMLLLMTKAVIAVFLAASIFYSLPLRDSRISSATKGVHSSVLSRKVSMEDSILVEQYLDSKGKLTFAADKHYALVRKQLNEDGHVVSEYYYDEQGMPARMSSGYYGILREYDEEGHEIKLTYVDAAGNPMITSSWYAMIVRTYDEEGNEIKEVYTDRKGDPVFRNEGYAGREKEYDEKGRCIRIVNLGLYGQPVMSANGYAAEERTFDDKNRVHSVLYYGLDGKPAANTLGQYGEEYEYDDLNRRYKITYLNQEGNPAPCRDGYATVIRSFRADNSTESEMYYDAYGKPIKLSHGGYGVRWVDGRKIYLTKSGRVNLLSSLNEILHDNTVAVVLIGLIICALAAFLPKTVTLILLASYVLFIIDMTLMYRKAGEPSGEFAVFWSYKELFHSRAVRIDTIDNIWLFVPLGTLLFFIFNKKRVLAIPLLFSVTIEILQYYTGRGLFEFDDMISNGLGGCIGYGIGAILQITKKRISAQRHMIPQPVHLAKRSRSNSNGDSSDKQQQTFLDCLRFSLFTGKTQNLSDDLYLEAQRQAVVPLVSTGSDSYTIITKNVQMVHEQKRIEEVLKNAVPPIPFVVLKGTAAAVYYPVPLRRTLGDIDIIVRPEDFINAYNTLKANGYHALDPLKKISWERELRFNNKGILIELHHAYAELNTQVRNILFDQWIYNGIPEATIGAINNQTFPMLTEPLNGLVLLAHICIHLETGLGFRQIIDWLMYVNRELHDECWPLFSERSDQLGLTKLAKVTARAGQLYLGLTEENITWCLDVDEKLCKELIDYVFECGNFGHKMGANNTVTMVFSQGKNFRKFLVNLQRNGERTWETLEKHPGLKPIAWIYQVFRWTFRAIVKDISPAELIRDYKDSKDRNRLMEELEVKKPEK